VSSRTIKSKHIVGGLILVIIGQWPLIFLAGHFQAQWFDQDDLYCYSKDSNRKILSAFFIYAMCFDLIVLLLTSYKLFVLNQTKMSGGSRVAQMIYVDGLIFFIVAFLVNLMATICINLNLNPLMDIMFSGPAAVFGSIVACRAVRRLKNSVQNVNVDHKMIPYPSCSVHIQICMETIRHCDEYQPGDVEKSLSSAVEEAKGGDQELVLGVAGRERMNKS